MSQPGGAHLQLQQTEAIHTTSSTTTAYSEPTPLDLLLATAQELHYIDPLAVKNESDTNVTYVLHTAQCYGDNNPAASTHHLASAPVTISCLEGAQYDDTILIGPNTSTSNNVQSVSSVSVRPSFGSNQWVIPVTYPTNIIKHHEVPPTIQGKIDILDHIG